MRGDPEKDLLSGRYRRSSRTTPSAGWSSASACAASTAPPSHAFSRACKKLSEARIIRPVAEDDRTITFQFTQEVPAGTDPADFDPCTEELYEEGDEGFVQLLLEIAPHLAEPPVVQAIGSIKCRFPLSACEWHVLPGGTEVQLNQFRASEPIAAPS